MGRFYNGDIDGKFWVAVQSSDDADFFGAIGSPPDILNYYFDEENVDEVNKGVQDCYDALGKNKEKMDIFFDNISGYNNQMIAEQTGIPIEEIKELLEWYARLELGLKIQKCLKDNGYCNFEAEC